MRAGSIKDPRENQRPSAATVDDRMLGDRPLALLTTDVCETFFDQLRQAGLAPSSRNKYRHFISALLQWAVKKGYLARDPIAGVETIAHVSEAASRRSRRLAPDTVDAAGTVHSGEERRLLAVAGDLQRLIVGALETCCRLGELLQLQWGDVDLTRREIRIRAATSKTRRLRLLPISTRLAAMLEMGKTDPTGQPFGPDAYVFGDAIGRKVTSPKRAWTTAVLKAHGITPKWTEANTLSPECRAHLQRIDLHLHDLRHEGGSRLLERGWPAHHVQTMLGHASLLQTSTYLNGPGSGCKTACGVSMIPTRVAIPLQTTRPSRLSLRATPPTIPPRRCW